jgi:mRNA-degrading endonuclease RelE of RelBE toxin-antitoxin system
MRTDNDICLLCCNDKATKKNSHIFPRFIGKSLIDNKNYRRAYTITDNLNKPKSSQDIPKQDYLFCPKCESLIADKFETPMSIGFFNIVDYKSDFFQVRIKNSFTYRVYYKVDYVRFKKFLYSMLFRASISDLIEFVHFKIDDSYEKEIRKMLLEEDYFQDYPVYLMSCRTNDPRENQILAENIVGNTYNLHANEYIVIFDLDNSKKFMDGFEHICMYREPSIKLCPLDEKNWKVLMDTTYKIMNEIKEKKKIRTN